MLNRNSHGNRHAQQQSTQHPPQNDMLKLHKMTSRPSIWQPLSRINVLVPRPLFVSMFLILCGACANLSKSSEASTHSRYPLYGADTIVDQNGDGIRDIVLTAVFPDEPASNSDHILVLCGQTGELLDVVRIDLPCDSAGSSLRVLDEFAGNQNAILCVVRIGGRGVPVICSLDGVVLWSLEPQLTEVIDLNEGRVVAGSEWLLVTTNESTTESSGSWTRAYPRGFKSLGATPTRFTPEQFSLHSDVDGDHKIELLEDDRGQDSCIIGTQWAGLVSGKNGGALFQFALDTGDLVAAVYGEDFSYFGSALATISNQATGETLILASAWSHYVGAYRPGTLDQAYRIDNPHDTAGQLDGFAESLIAVHDLDGDGHEDFAVGCLDFFYMGGEVSAPIHVYSGRDGAWLGDYDCGLKRPVVLTAIESSGSNPPLLIVGLPDYEEIAAINLSDNSVAWVRKVWEIEPAQAE